MKQVEYRKNIPPAQNVNVKCESDLQFRPHLISTKARSNSFLCLLLSLSFFGPPFWIFVEVSADNSFPDFRSPFPTPRSPFAVLVTSVWKVGSTGETNIRFQTKMDKRDKQNLQQLCACIRYFCFFAVTTRQRRENFFISRFIEIVNTRQRFSFPFFNSWVRASVPRVIAGTEICK